MTDTELDALELYLRQHGTVGPQAADAITELRQERDNWCALAAAANADLLAARHDIERHVAIATEQATEIEELRNDALRYRWLREHMTWTTHEEFPGTDLSYLTRRWYHETTTFRASTIDEVVDAALRREET
jgi:hypothetical protein